MRTIKNLSLLCFFAQIAAFANAQNLDSALVLHYPFNGSAAEARGTGNNGVVTGARLTTDRFGNRNSAYLFDGKDDYVKIGNRVLTDTSGTISAWIWVKDSIGRNPIFSQGQESALANSFRFTVWSDSLAAVCDHRNCGTSKDLPTIKAKANVLYTNWMHVALTSNGSQYKMYVNGVEYNYSKTNQPGGQWLSKVCATSQSAFIGRWKRKLNDEYFEGKLDDIRIYNRALHRNEITQLATQGQCFETVYDSVTVYDTLVVNDTLYTTIFDTNTVILTDTVSIVDTTIITMRDTVSVFDTIRTSITDTLLIDLTTVGVNEDEHNTLKVYPNPTAGHLVIDNGNYQLMKDHDVKIISTTGKTVFDSGINRQQFQVDLSQFGGKGLYFLQLYNPKGELLDVKKVVLH